MPRLSPTQRDSLREQGICTHCAKHPAAPGRVRCEHCTTLQGIAWNKRYHRRVAEGYCAKCITRKVKTGQYCLQCAPTGPRRKGKRRTFRAINLWSMYHLTEQDWQRMFDEQGGACASCNIPDIQLVVDHDHITGQVRALLCRSCNSICGWLEKSKSEIQDCIAYLQLFA